MDIVNKVLYKYYFSEEEHTSLLDDSQFGISALNEADANYILDSVLSENFSGVVDKIIELHCPEEIDQKFVHNLLEDCHRAFYLCTLFRALHFFSYINNENMVLINIPLYLHSETQTNTNYAVTINIKPNSETQNIKSIPGMLYTAHNENRINGALLNSEKINTKFRTYLKKLKKKNSNFAKALPILEFSQDTIKLLPDEEITNMISAESSISEKKRFATFESNFIWINDYIPSTAIGKVFYDVNSLLNLFKIDALNNENAWYQKRMDLPKDKAILLNQIEEAVLSRIILTVFHCCQITEADTCDVIYRKILSLFTGLQHYNKFFQDTYTKFSYIHDKRKKNISRIDCEFLTPDTFAYYEGLDRVRKYESKFMSERNKEFYPVLFSLQLKANLYLLPTELLTEELFYRIYIAACRNIMEKNMTDTIYDYEKNCWVISGATFRDLLKKIANSNNIDSQKIDLTKIFTKISFTAIAPEAYLVNPYFYT